MKQKLIVSMALFGITQMVMSTSASTCNKNTVVFSCQTKANTQVSLCKQGNQYHYEYGDIGHKPKQAITLPKHKVTFEYYVIEGTRTVYSVEFVHQSITYGLTSNFPRYKSDKTPAYAIMIQSQNHDDKILASTTCRIDTLTDNIKKFQ